MREDRFLHLNRVVAETHSYLKAAFEGRLPKPCKSSQNPEQFFQGMFAKMTKRGPELLNTGDSADLWGAFWKGLWFNMCRDMKKLLLWPEVLHRRTLICEGAWPGFWITQLEFDELQECVMGQFSSFGIYAAAKPRYVRRRSS